MEASPEDKAWGMGMRADDPRAIDRRLWLGENLLGDACAVTRQMISQGIEPPPSKAGDAVLAMLDAIDARRAASLGPKK